MRVEIMEVSRNQVSWEVKTPLLAIAFGLWIGLLIFGMIVLPTPGTVRWILLGVVGLVVLVATLYLALTTPISERGRLVRKPYGAEDRGEARREQLWLLGGKWVAWVVPLEAITSFGLELRRFGAVGNRSYYMARLWARPLDCEPVLVADWGDPQEVEDLGMALAKTSRRRFEISKDEGGE
jgi:hypothetical protein